MWTHLIFKINKSFAIYGLGLTGKSMVKFLKKNKVKKILLGMILKLKQIVKKEKIQKWI